MKRKRKLTPPLGPPIVQEGRDLVAKLIVMKLPAEASVVGRLTNALLREIKINEALEEQWQQHLNSSSSTPSES